MKRVASCAQPMTEPHELPASHTGSRTCRARGAMRAFPEVPSSRDMADTPARLAGLAMLLTCASRTRLVFDCRPLKPCCPIVGTAVMRGNVGQLDQKSSRQGETRVVRTSCATGWKPNKRVALHAGMTFQSFATPLVKVLVRSCMGEASVRSIAMTLLQGGYRSIVSRSHRASGATSDLQHTPVAWRERSSLTACSHQHKQEKRHA